MGIRDSISGLVADISVTEPYTCPVCGERALLIRGPKGRGPLTKDGPLSELLEALRDVSQKEESVVEVHLTCSTHRGGCGYDERREADDELVEEIVRYGL